MLYHINVSRHRNSGLLSCWNQSLYLGNFRHLMGMNLVWGTYSFNLNFQKPHVNTANKGDIVWHGIVQILLSNKSYYKISCARWERHPWDNLGATLDKIMYTIVWCLDILNVNKQSHLGAWKGIRQSINCEAVHTMVHDTTTVMMAPNVSQGRNNLWLKFSI